MNSMNRMKKLLCTVIAMTLLGMPAFAEELPAFGVCVYDGTDTFMASLRLHLETYAQGKARLTVYDSRNDQNLQNDQVESMLEAGVDVLIINPVDRLAAGYLIEKAGSGRLRRCLSTRSLCWRICSCMSTLFMWARTARKADD